MRDLNRTVVVAAVLGVCAAGALADGMIVPVRPDLRVRGAWAVRYHHVTMTVRDQVASVTVDQEFVNTGRVPVEVEYLFPIPPSAAVSSMTLVVNGKEMAGKLLKADEARKIYEGIVRRKKDPALLEYAGFGLFRTKAFPLEPGKPAKVVVNYSDVCKKQGDLVRIWYPLNTEKYSARPVQSVKVVMDVKSKGELAPIYSPTHEIVVKHKAKGHAVITYEAKKVLPTTDVVVYYKASSTAVGATLLTHQPDPNKDGYFLLLVSPTPRSGGEIRAMPKDVVLVLDRSGSMAGRKSRQAREALEYVVRNLNPDDRFNIVTYSDEAEPFFETLLGATEKNVAEALSQLARLEAEGGTNIHEALQTAMRMFDLKQGMPASVVDGRPKYVLFLTDGLPTTGQTPEHTTEKRILADTAKANTAGVRLFAFGVGYNVNVRLLDKLVIQNNGRSDYIREAEAAEKKISALYAKIRNPIMTDLKVTIHGVKLRQVYPRRMGDLFDGDQIVLAGRYDVKTTAALVKLDGRPSAQLVITGRYLGEPKGFEYPVSFRKPGKRAAYAFVDRLWAMRRIGYLLDQVQFNGSTKELTDELVQLSLTYGIITPYTSFLAREDVRRMPAPARRKRAEKALEDMLQTEGVAGQRNAMNRQRLNDARAPLAPTTRPGGGVQVYGHESDGDYDKGKETRTVRTVRNVGNQTLYRRGRLWVTPETEKLDLTADAAKIQVIERFSDAYFTLIHANTTDQNRVIAAQGEDEELMVELRGQVYRIR